MINIIKSIMKWDWCILSAIIVYVVVMGFVVYKLFS